MFIVFIPKKILWAVKLMESQQFLLFTHCNQLILNSIAYHLRKSPEFIRLFKNKYIEFFA